ncbi:MAG TPA: hypothetical protein VFS29_08315 [Motilibacteraceae bacterium]|nr:hypothetical protein [Motilibacteraceae bacterium]
MSIPVPLDELATTLERFAAGYLLTVSADFRAHPVAVRPVVRDGVLELPGGLGRRSGENALARPDVTLLWPPVADDGYTLIVDGRAEARGESVVVRPTTAVLHRPADHGGTAAVG